MSRKNLDVRSGFTLLEIILVLVIVGVIAVFAIAMTSSVRGAAKTGATRNTMEEIAAKAKSFYRNSERLPDPANTDEVPVEQTALNLENKYRYDAWGTPFEYHPGGSASPYDDINYFTVDGNVCAGVIISLGPNQQVDYTPNTPGSTDFNTAGDDLLIPIDVTQAAVEIALDELKTLQAKVMSFDAMYLGVDNDGDGTVDEDGLVAEDGTACPDGVATVDPNSGMPTLDAITGYTCTLTGTPGQLSFILTRYSLADPKYRNDPWGNSYVWGDGTTTYPHSANTDPRRHKFFSMGPDGAADTTDDILP